MRVDLPEPLTPVMHVNVPSGILTDIPCRLCSRGLWMVRNTPCPLRRSSRTGMASARDKYRPVSEAVWKLYRLALHIIGDRPTLIERDTNFPPLQELLDEAAYADGLRRWASTGEVRNARAA